MISYDHLHCAFAREVKSQSSSLISCNGISNLLDFDSHAYHLKPASLQKINLPPLSERSPRFHRGFEKAENRTSCFQIYGIQAKTQSANLAEDHQFLRTFEPDHLSQESSYWVTPGLAKAEYFLTPHPRVCLILLPMHSL
jgi:hypothetical protein